MKTITIASNASDTNAVFLTDHDLRSSQETVRLNAGARQLPPAADAGEAYYWTHAWQTGQQEAVEAIERGEAITFDNADDAIRWLLSSDES